MLPMKRRLSKERRKNHHKADKKSNNYSFPVAQERKHVVSREGRERRSEKT